MASTSFGGGITNVVGSHGGNTFARNKGGSYLKRKPHGTNPRSTQQLVARSRMNHVGKYYSFTLSDADRATWRAYAAANSVVNRLGNTVFLSGHQMFCRQSINLLQNGGSIVNTAPASAAVGTPSSIIIDALSGGGGHLHVTCGCAGLGGSDFVNIWVTPPLNPGRAFVSSQLRKFNGASTPNVLLNLTLAYTNLYGALPASPGQRIFVQFCVLNTVTGTQSVILQGNALWT